jgi:hypothetical protein
VKGALQQGGFGGGAVIDGKNTYAQGFIRCGNSGINFFDEQGERLPVVENRHDNTDGVRWCAIHRVKDWRRKNNAYKNTIFGQTAHDEFLRACRKNFTQATA